MGRIIKMEKKASQKKSNLQPFMLVLLGGFLTIMGGFLSSGYLNKLESKKSEQGTLWQIYSDLENFRMNKRGATYLIDIKSVSLLLDDKEFGAQIHYYVLSELKKLDMLNNKENELINKMKDRIISEEELLEKIKCKLNPKIKKLSNKKF